MKILTRKDVYILLIINAFFSLLLALDIIAESFYPFDGSRTAYLYLFISLLFLAYILFCLIIPIRLRKKKGYSFLPFLIFEFILLIGLFYLDFIFSLYPGVIFGSYFLFISLGIVTADILFKTFCIIYISRLMRKGPRYDYLAFFKYLSWVFLDSSLVIFINYAASYLKITMLLNFLSEFVINKSLSVGAFITYFIFFIISISIALHQLYLFSSSFITYKEKKALHFKGNSKYAISLYRKYDIAYFFGIFTTALMLITAIISCTTLFVQYISLVALYAMVLLVRIPNYIQDKRSEKKYGNKPELLYKKRHNLNFYTAMLFFIYTAIIVIYGNSSLTKMDDTRPMVIVMSIFAPYTIAKLVNCILKYRKMRLCGDPCLRNQFYADLVLVIFTIVNTLFMIAMSLDNGVFRTVGSIISSVLIAICVYIGIRLIVEETLAYKELKPKELRRFVKSYKENKK